MKGIIRKTILGIWFFGGLSACTSKPHFTIEGSLDEKVAIISVTLFHP